LDNHCNEYIFKALKIASDLMDLANNKDAFRDESGCGILSGVMRDCAYKIRQYAERERQAHMAKARWVPGTLEIQQKQNFNPKRLIMILVVALILGAAPATPANATTIIISTTNTETLGGLTFENADLAEYDPATDTATLFFDEDLFTANENIDAVHVPDNGHIILSTVGAAELGGLSLRNGDLVEYDPVSGTATLFFSEDLFSSNEDIDAVSILANGNIVLSTVGAATLGGLTFADGDLIEYNPVTDIATLYLDGDLFADGENIDAADVLASGNIILSTVNAATLGGLTFRQHDLVEYNPLTDVATLYLSGDLFSNVANINAVHIVTTVPEPATIVLLGLASLVLIRPR